MGEREIPPFPLNSFLCELTEDEENIYAKDNFQDKIDEDKDDLKDNDKLKDEDDLDDEDVLKNKEDDLKTKSHCCCCSIWHRFILTLPPPF